jgi:WS/DGAT/MGAT family acyltransferase
MTDTLTALDATFLELEERSAGAMMNVGGVMVFDPAPGGHPGPAQVASLLRSRLAALPRYRHRLSAEHPGPWVWPRWVDDDRFAVSDHVSNDRLPAPGGERELHRWIAQFASRQLERDRPLWELVVLEGLPGGRWALAHKVHHALIDGTGSVGVAELILDTEPAADGAHDAEHPDVDDGSLPDPAAYWTTAPHRADSDALWRSLLPGAADPVVRAAETGAHALSAALHATLRPQETLSRSRMLAELIFEDEVLGAPRTSLNVDIGAARRYGSVHVPAGELREIREQLGGSIHDAALAACTAGLRRLLIERAESLPDGGLRAMVPVTLRDAAERLTLGGHLGSLFVALPVAEPVAAVRHRLIVEQTLRRRAEGVGEAAGTLIDLAALAPPLVHASLARLLYGTRLFNLTITGVIATSGPRYAFGAPLREVYPMMPLAAHHAVAIGITTHDEAVMFGITADGDSVPDLDVLLAGIAEGIADLLAMTRGGRARGAQTPGRSAPT